LACALLSIFVFTASIVLAFTVVLTVAMVVACQAGTMFVGLGWDFGAIEAISLILFVGFSVDYTLHFAEAFHVSPPPKIENALMRVGRAIVSAGTTTAGSAAFLVFCTIEVFNNFGLAVVLNTMWSLIFALIFYPATLSFLPKRYHEDAYLPTFCEDDDEEFASAEASAEHPESAKAQHEEGLSQSTANTLPSTAVSNSSPAFGATELGRALDDDGAEIANAGLGTIKLARGPSNSAPQPTYSPQIEAARAARERFNAACNPSATSEAPPAGVARPATPSQTQVSIESL
jgi:multidrug efflux pump subunit AcrB